MDDIINELIRLDQRARAVVTEAEHESARKKALIKKEKADVHAEYLERAHKRIEQVKQQAKQDAQRQVREQEKEFEQAQARLDNAYEQHHDAWVEQMIARCVRPGLTG